MAALGRVAARAIAAVAILAAATVAAADESRAAHLHGSAVREPAPDKPVNGIVFAAGEWAPAGPDFAFGSAAAHATLLSLAATGATHARILVAWYQASVNATSIYPVTSAASPLRSSTASEVAAAIRDAHALGLRVTLSPMVDVDWSQPGNCRGAQCGSAQAGRWMFGQAFTSDAEWAQWFGSYQHFIETYVNGTAAAAASTPDELVIGAELNVAAQRRASDWRALVSHVRDGLGFKGSVHYASAGDERNITWWDAVDSIGVNAYALLRYALPAPAGHLVRHNVSVSQLKTAWAPVVTQLAAMSSRHGGKRVLFTEVGWQSRPNAVSAPGGIVTMDPTDCSCWELCIDTDMQNNAYETLFSVFWKQPWFGGAYVAMWTTDPTQGGTADDSFSPVGKPAHAALAAAYGGKVVPPGSVLQAGQPQAASKDTVDSIASPAPRTFEPGAALRELRARHRSSAAGAAHGATATASPSASTAKPKTNGMVFGGGQWSSPQFRLDSPQARASLAQYRNATHGNSVRVVLTWYVDSVTSLYVWPANGTSNLRSATVREVSSLLQYAGTLGLQVQLAPYIDPDWDLPGNCRGPSCGKIPGSGPKTGRGSVGAGFSDAQWQQWFDTSALFSYGAYVMTWARVAAQFRSVVPVFCVGAELEVAFAKAPPQLWRALIAEVRAVFDGKVTIAVNSGEAVAQPPKIAWYDAVDVIGVEGYFSLPTNGSGLPPRLEAWKQPVAELTRLHAATGKDIMFTEVGYQPRTGSHNSPASTNLTTPYDCTVWSLCYDLEEQALDYEALLTSLYPLDWFVGVHWWMWRSDPSAAGTSDASFSPHGKPAAQVLAKWYSDPEWK